ncbi:MAG TPA: tetratricopeptide repeat protein [Planctomycetes bacterium]|nr:tetratricopeptide repeat protein [Planctomycetota bacterium]
MKNLVSIALVAFLCGGAWAQSSRKMGLTGWDYFQQKRYAEALELLEKDHRMWPKIHEIVDGIGWCHYFLGHIDEAERWFKKALELEEDYRFSKMGLEAVARARQKPLRTAQGLLEAGRYAEAEKAFSELIADKGNRGEDVQVEALNGRGYARYHLGRYNEAIKDFTRALRIRKDNPGSLIGLGYVQYARRRWNEAELALEKALEIQPDHLLAALTYAWCAYRRGRFDDAERRFETILETHPSSWGAWLGLGWARIKRHRESQALEAFHKALELSPQALTADLAAWIRADEKRQTLWIPYGYSLIEAGSYAAALGVFRSLPPNVAARDAALGEAIASLNLGDNLGALRAAKGLLDRGLDPVRALLTPLNSGKSAKVQVSASTVAGWASLRLGDLDEAKAFFDQAQALPGKWPDALTGLGWVALAERAYPAAENYFRGALGLLPDYPGAVQGLAKVKAWRYQDYDRAWTALNAGDLDRAESILQALRVDSSGRFPAARSDLIDYSLGKIAELRGQARQAEKLYAAALEKNPALVEARVGLGWAWLTLARYQEAIDVLEKVLPVRPADPRIPRMISRALVEMGKADEAVRRLEGWVKAFPRDPELNERLGTLLEGFGRRVEARIAYSAALSADPDRLSKKQLSALLAQKEYFPLYGVRAWALYSRGRYAEALRDFEKAHELEPGEVGHLKGLALTLAALGRLKEAVKQADAYMKHLGKSPSDLAERRSLLVTLGWRAYGAGDYKRALDIFRGVRKKDGEDTADLANALGWTWLRMNKPLRAREWFLKALAQSPRLESALAGLEAVKGALNP